MTKGKKNDYERIEGRETIRVPNRNRESPQKNKEREKIELKTIRKRRNKAK